MNWTALLARSYRPGAAFQSRRFGFYSDEVAERLKIPEVGFGGPSFSRTVRGTADRLALYLTRRTAALTDPPAPIRITSSLRSPVRLLRRQARWPRRMCDPLFNKEQHDARRRPLLAQTARAWAYDNSTRNHVPAHDGAARSASRRLAGGPNHTSPSAGCGFSSRLRQRLSSQYLRLCISRVVRKGDPLGRGTLL